MPEADALIITGNAGKSAKAGNAVPVASMDRSTGLVLTALSLFSSCRTMQASDLTLLEASDQAFQ